MKKTYLILAIIMLFGVFAVSCNNENKDDRPTVAVTIAPEKTFVYAVCKDTVNIVTMVPSGASPESYDPTPKEMTAMSKACVYFSVGVPSEDNILPSLPKSVKEVKLDEAVRKNYPDLTLGDERDPHIWLSVRRVKIMIEKICDTMCDIYGENSDIYKKNSLEYLSLLDSTDAEIRNTLASVENRGFIVYHPSFGYFADEYSLTMYALEEEGKEATAQHMKDVINLAKENKINVIFYQAENAGKQAKAFAEELEGGVAVQLDPLSDNYIENLKVMASEIAKAAK